MRVTGVVTLAFVAVVLAGCVSEEVKTKGFATQQAPGQSVKTAALAYARTTFFDPYSIRDAQISSVLTRRDGRSAVCIRANAKNRMGAYTGLQVTSLVIENGRVVAALTGDMDCNDARMMWRPFPELEAV